MGIFLADITLFTQINVTWSLICRLLVEINSILPGLERVVILMNLPTDLPDRRKLLRRDHAFFRMSRGLKITFWLDSGSMLVQKRDLSGVKWMYLLLHGVFSMISGLGGISCLPRMACEASSRRRRSA